MRDAIATRRSRRLMLVAVGLLAAVAVGIVLVVLGVTAPGADAQIPLTAADQAYAQTFNILAASGQSSSLPSGWVMMAVPPALPTAPSWSAT